jgi:hypothetical protein
LQSRSSTTAYTTEACQTNSGTRTISASETAFKLFLQITIESGTPTLSTEV